MLRTHLAPLTLAALSLAQPADSLDIHVHKNNGRVILSGEASSPAERTLAEQAANGIFGVNEVHNLIQVVPNSPNKAPEASDQEIAQRVDQAVDEALPSGNQIEVRNVENGVVVLGGNARTVTEHYEALVATNRVAGVRAVKSEIQSPDELADRARGAVEDDAIEKRVASALRARGSLRNTDIHVAVSQRVARLTGDVPSQSARNLALLIARRAPGVTGVLDELRIATTAVSSGPLADGR